MRAEIHDFACNIKERNVVVHYFSKGQAYVGEVKRQYYFVTHGSDRDYFKKYIREKNRVNRAPYRINVEWLRDENGSARLFDGVRFNWYDTVHRILKEDLNRVDNKKLREYLERKIKE